MKNRMNLFTLVVILITALALLELTATSAICLRNPELIVPLLLEESRLVGWYIFWVFGGLCLPILAKFKYQFRTITDLVMLNAYQAGVILAILFLGQQNTFAEGISGVLGVMLLYHFSKYLIAKYG